VDNGLTTIIHDREFHNLIGAAREESVKAGGFCVEVESFHVFGHPMSMKQMRLMV
jgi:hypothetical protein